MESGVEHYDITASRIYKMVSSTDNRCFFVPYYVASSIIDKMEYTSKNKVELSIEENNNDSMSIKAVCVPIKFNRLGEMEKR